jgi:hypothetical protein
MARLSATVLMTLTICAPVEARPVTYTNARFGTSVTFPDEVFSRKMAAPANGDGMSWTSADGASLAVFGSNNVLEQSPKELADQVSLGLKVTYSRIGKDWAVLSGFDGGLVFYERFEFGASGAIHSVLITYPAEKKAVYDLLVGPIADSMQGP